MAMASDSDSDARNGGGSESGSKTPSASPSATRGATAASPGPVAGVYSSGCRRMEERVDLCEIQQHTDQADLDSFGYGHGQRRTRKLASLICSGGWIGALRKKQASK
ncbi:unnamed protein product [Urochloa humidicola]